MMVKCHQDTVLFGTSEDETVEIQLGNGEDKMSKAKIGEDVEIHLSLKMLTIFAKANKFTDNMVITIEDDREPIKMKYTFGDNEITFFLTPQERD